MFAAYFQPSWPSRPKKICGRNNKHLRYVVMLYIYKVGMLQNLLVGRLYSYKIY